MTEAEPRPVAPALPAPAGGRLAAAALRALLGGTRPPVAPIDDRDDVTLRTLTGA